MTILTKPSNEKKSEKAPLQLGLGRPDEPPMLQGGGMPHRQLLDGRYVDAESMVFNHPPVSFVKTLLMFLISLVIMLMAMLGGYTLYQMFVPEHQNLHFRAMCDIPYTSDNNLTLPRIHERNNEFDFRDLFARLTGDNTFDDVDDNFFREEIELDMSENQSYAKINVPDFKDGRRGRFMHDFKENQSAIIDTTANRCFIMPLDRETTLPPKSFMDLMQKMGTGYYNIDTERVRRTMRVVTPPISDISQISERIANECFEMNVYMLEKYVSGVFKREAKPITEAGKFAEFMGKGVVEFDLMNIADIEEFESKQQKK